MLSRNLYCTVVFILLVVLVSSSSFAAVKNIDVESELAKNKATVLVVKFYTSFIKEDQQTVKAWGDLLKQYKKSGLRFYLISEDQDVCKKSKNLKADKFICDEEGLIKDQFSKMIKAENLALPSYFIFSWEGKLSKMTNSSQTALELVENYYANNEYKLWVAPIEVEGGKLAITGKTDWVGKELNAQLKKRGKFGLLKSEVVATATEDKAECKDMLTKNSKLVTKLQGFESGERLMTLSLESGNCPAVSASFPYKGHKGQANKKSVIKAIEKNLGTLYGKLIKVGEVKLVDIPDAVVEAEYTVEFKPQPDGSKVEINGKTICEFTPCTKKLKQDTYDVVISRNHFNSISQKLIVDKDMVVDWKLESKYAWLSITTDYPGVPIMLNGEEIGKTPIKNKHFLPGKYNLEINDRCYLPETKEITLSQNQIEAITMGSTPIMSGVNVLVKNEKDQLIKADIYVNGEKIGEAPGRFKVNHCTSELEIRADGYELNWKKLFLKKNRTTKLEVVLKEKPGVAAVAPVIEEPEYDEPLFPADKGAGAMMKAGWSTLVVGAVLVAIGGGMHKLAIDEESANDNFGTGDKSAHDAYKYSAISLYAAGGALFTTGLTLLIVDHFQQKKLDKVVPAVGTDGKGVQVSWNFTW